MRKTRLVDCSPELIPYTGREGDPIDAIRFACPEGHADCHHTVQFTPAMDGSSQPPRQRNGAQWIRSGDTFDVMTLSPSIRRTPPYSSREDAIARGAIPELVTDSLLCACHVFIRAGMIDFCGDSR